MARIFAYIVHKGGVADDTAAELPAAARKIDAGAACYGHRHRLGRRISTRVCESLRVATPRSGRSPSEPLAYPNAELVRKALARACCRPAASCWFRTPISAWISRRGFPSR